MLTQPVTVAERLAARPVDLFRPIREMLPGAGNRPPKWRAHTDALVGVEDGGLPEVGPWQATVLLPERLEPMQVPRCRHRLGGPHDVVAALGAAKHVRVRRLGKPAVVVQITKLALLGVIDDQRAVAAEDVRVHRLDDRQRRRHRDGRVERVATQLEDLDPRLGGASMRRGHHPRGTGRTVRAHDPREGFDRLGRLRRCLDDILGATEYAETGEHDR